MLNCEKWKDTLKELASKCEPIALDLKGIPCACSEMNCGNCLFADNSTALQKCNSANLYDWLCEEYKEPEIDWDNNIDWKRVPVDTEVLIRSSEGNEWRKGKFAIYMPNNPPYYGIFGNNEERENARYLNFYYKCKLANEDDIEKYRKR